MTVAAQPAKRALHVHAVLEFKKQVDSCSLEPEYMKKLPMAMSSYEWMFNCCRVPKKPADTSVKYPYQENPHIVVIRKNQFWKVRMRLMASSSTQVSWSSSSREFMRRRRGAHLWEFSLRKTETYGQMYVYFPLNSWPCFFGEGEVVGEFVCD